MHKFLSSHFFKKLLRNTFLVSFLCLSFPSIATHLMGSDITYRVVGRYKYEITLKIYRECNPVVLEDNQTIRLKCIEDNTFLRTFSIPKVSVKDVTGVNQSYIKSKCQGGNFKYGIEEHTYRGIIDVRNGNYVSSCTELKISWSKQARNKTITTGAGGFNFYTEATIITTVEKGNVSPVFAVPPAALVCLGEDFTFNNGAMDTIDNDILTFKLIEPLSADGQPIPYIPPYSAQQPLNYLGFPNANTALPAGFHLDSLTGDLNFRPTLANQVSVLVIEVTEWRKENGIMRVVGKTRRDIQIIVISCEENTPPKIIGTGDTVCVGEQVCIHVGTFDADEKDSVRLVWNNSVSGAKFTLLKSTNPKRDSAIICWTPPEGYNRKEAYNFIITALDNASPLRRRTVRSIKVFVNPLESPEFEINQSEQCLKNQDFDFTNTANNTTQYTYSWVFSNGEKFTTKNVNNYSFNAVGDYAIKLLLKDENNCVSTTTKIVKVKPHPEIDISSTGIKTAYCVSNKPYSLLPISSLGILEGKNISGVATYTAKEQGTDFITYKLNLLGCASDTVIKVEVYPSPEASYGVNNDSQCFNTQQFNFKNTTPQQGIFTSSWFFSDGQKLENISEAKGIKFASAGQFEVKLVVESPGGCKDSFTNKVRVFEEPNPTFTGLDTIYCENSTATILQPEQTGGSFSGLNVTANQYIPKTTGNDSVTYSIEVNGCRAKSTQYTYVKPLPTLPQIKNIYNCYKNPIKLDAKYPNATYLWSDGSTLPTFTINQIGKYWVSVFNECGATTKNIEVKDCFYGAFPNTFSPNGDGLNDIFMPYIENAETFTMTIYNRWGQELFKTTDFDKGWDGTFNNNPVQQETYVYLITVEYYDEDNILRKENHQNTITLLR